MTDIKTLIRTSAILFLLLCLSACTAKKETQTYFIHAAYFDISDGNIAATMLVERMSGDKSKFFTVVQKEKNLDTVCDQLQNKYRECYFATCDLLFINDSADEDFLFELAEQLCRGNRIPITSDIFCLKDSAKEFFKAFEKYEDLAEFKNKLSHRKVNSVAFFANYSSGKDATLSLIESEKHVGKITFIKGKDAEIERK